MKKTILLILFALTAFCMKPEAAGIRTSPVSKAAAGLSAADDSGAQTIIPDGSIVVVDQYDYYCIKIFAPDSSLDDSGLLWSWSPDDAPDLDGSFFSLPTDAKRVLGGTHVLYSSSGGIALISMDKTVEFAISTEGLPHSVELLPDNNIVVVTGSDDGGNTISVVATGSSPYEATYDFPGAHGLAWDANRQVLWALGNDEIRQYSYDFVKDQPTLTENISFPLTIGYGGHDLFPVPGQDQLYFTTVDTVGVFDCATGDFAPVSVLDGVGNIKSISQDGPGGDLLYSDYSDTLWFIPGSPEVSSGSLFYKARWWLPNQFSYPE